MTILNTHIFNSIVTHYDQAHNLTLTSDTNPTQESPLKNSSERNNCPEGLFTIRCQQCQSELHRVEPEHPHESADAKTVQNNRIYRSLRSHADKGHEMQLSFYGDNTSVENIAIECRNCYTVLHDIEPAL